MQENSSSAVEVWQKDQALVDLIYAACDSAEDAAAAIRAAGWCSPAEVQAREAKAWTSGCGAGVTVETLGLPPNPYRPTEEAVPADAPEDMATDDDLPGMWSHSDFMGGDPDERSYAERERQAVPVDAPAPTAEPERHEITLPPGNVGDGPAYCTTCGGFLCIEGYPERTDGGWIHVRDVVAPTAEEAKPECDHRWMMFRTLRSLMDKCVKCGTVR